jgi:hypothetical protein
VVTNARGLGHQWLQRCFLLLASGLACSAVRDHAGVRDTLNNQLTCGLVLACIALMSFGHHVRVESCIDFVTSRQATCLGQHR